MTQTHTPQSAYGSYQRTGETIRETEAHALLSCASKLEAARDPSISRADFGSAIRHNQKLWTFFQVCLCEPDNALPRDLKVLLLNLSRYVDKTSFRAVKEDNRQLLNSLVNINRTIAAGLAKTPPDAQAQPTSTSPQNLTTSA